MHQWYKSSSVQKPALTGSSGKYTKSLKQSERESRIDHGLRI
jgi:hypothetical protein